MKLRVQGIPELWVGSERLGESPDRLKNILQRFGFRTLWRCLAYCGNAATLGGWHPNAPSPSPWHGEASCFEHGGVIQGLIRRPVGTHPPRRQARD